MRLMTNPATSRLTMMGSFLIDSTNSRPAAKAASLVMVPRITSTACIMGTGEKKWMPRKRSGLSTWEASSLMGMALVLLATKLSGLSTGLSLA